MSGLINGLAARLAQAVNLKAMGADPTGTLDAAPAINAALASGADLVTADNGTFLINSTVSIPPGVMLLLGESAKLKMGANVNAVRLHAGGRMQGGIIDCTLAGWNAAAIEINGDDYGSSVQFAMSIKTTFSGVRLYGSFGNAAGTAVYGHADGIANARIMGVKGDARVWGFNRGLWLTQSSTDGSKFITSNEFDLKCDETVQPLFMASATTNGYNVDGNRIRIEGQPWPSTTSTAMTLCGQLNTFDLLEWDWNTVAAAAPYAIVLTAGMRNNVLNTQVSGTYIQDNSATGSNFMNMVGDGVMRAATIGAPNGQGLTLLASSAAGSNLVYDTNNATGVHAWRIAGSNAMFLTADKALHPLGPLYPASAVGTENFAGGLWGGSGVPAAALGANGDFFFRSDGAAGSAFYQKRTGAWVAVA